MSAVELKGSDIRHAMTQIENTLDREGFKNSCNRKTAVIVYSHSPSNINTAKQNFKERMLKHYQTRVFYQSNGSTIDYSLIFS
ncbi:hypothetical protein ACFIQF_02615 [Comamonas sp. J-3]|uniref:hypothetical protein n=1 Tax=Comamonas trifloxystrobinivorans TaxID=3350256 RepID=UPI003728F95C